MIQELFHVGPFAISPFGVMLVAAFLAAYAQLSRGLVRFGAGDADAASALVFAAGVGGIVGAKAYYAILYGDWRLLFERYGLVWYGGFLLGATAVVFTMRRRRMPVWSTLDAAAPALALGYGIGRIGCFLVGDDYGIPTRLPWGVAFANGLPPTTAWNLRHEFGVAVPSSISDAALVRVHPTQLYETALALLIWWVARRLMARRQYPGQVTLPILGLLAIERFGVEFLRAKDDRFLGPLTMAQAISLIVVAVAIALALSRRRRAGAPARSVQAR